ncbi:hypothetical protein RUM44_010896 [Polyplax serrata]|uniref:Protein lin-10 n=1 Tax=Polyplax serrata TaxID=468196 RepID=A0ABR1ANG0_POLSC
MTSVVSLQLDGNDLNEQITKLFPKCRPRDLNLNPVHDDLLDNNAFMMNLEKEITRCGNEKSEEILEEEEGNGSQENESSSNDDEDFNNEDLVVDHAYSGSEGQVIVLQSSKGATYKLRDSRIIEIAGGRELFSQSRAKALRNKPRCNNEHMSDTVDKGTVKSKTQSNKNVWDVENVKGNNREVTETFFSTEIHSVKHKRSSNPPVTLSYSGSGLNSITGGNEVVVFDDIGDDSSWRKKSEGKTLGRRKESISSSPSPPSYHQNPSSFFKVAPTSVPDVSGKTSQEMESSKALKVIGGLPIAEYDGSPRRYWPRHSDTSQNATHPTLPSAHSLLASPSVYPPRPGFPQRVVTANSGSDQIVGNKQSSTSPSPNQTTSNSTFDYLYEFSETRKVLEEFFKQTDVGPHTIQDFDELGYELRRQAGRGSAYVGLRLAKGVGQEGASQKSPQKISHPTLSENHTQNSREQDVTEHENNFLDLSADSASTEDLGDTEVGLQVGLSRNFTLSPETTDCDSNCGDLDSEVSLLLMDNDMTEQQIVQGHTDQNDEMGPQGTDSLRVYSSMPILEDGLSSGHASDTDNNNPTVILMKRQISEIEREIIQRQNNKANQVHVVNGSTKASDSVSPVNKQSEKNTLTEEKHLSNFTNNNKQNTNRDAYENDPEIEALDPLNASQVTPPPPAPAPHRSLSVDTHSQETVEAAIKDIRLTLQRTKTLPLKSPSEEPNESSGSPIWVPRRKSKDGAEYESRKSRNGSEDGGEDEEADTDLETDRLLGQQRTDDHGFYDDKLVSELKNLTVIHKLLEGKGWKKPKTRTVMPSLINSTKTMSTPLIPSSTSVAPMTASPPIDSHAKLSVSTDVSPLPPPSNSGLVVDSPLDNSPSPIKDNGVAALTSKVKKEKDGSKKRGRNKEVLIHEPSVLIEGVLFRARYLGSTQLVCEGQPTKSTRMMQAEEAVSRIKAETHFAANYKENRIVPLGSEHCPNLIDLTSYGMMRVKHGETLMVTNLDPKGSVTSQSWCTTSSAYEGSFDSDENELSESENVMIPVRPGIINLKKEAPLGIGPIGTIFRLLFLGSVEVEEEGGRKRRKRLKKCMVEEAVNKIKAPEGETQPSTEVDLFISTEKIMVLNTDLKEIMMDHALRTISYIADIGDLVVLMARRRYVPHDVEESSKMNRTPKMICHVFESEEAQFIAQSIGQAFQVAYMEFLKANGIEDHSFVKEMDYQEVLNSQEIFGDELQMFAKKEMQKEVVVPKAKGEILGVVIVESGWGSMLPTVVIANLAPAGAAARCGQLNIGDQIIAINGISLVGLPLSTCQTYIKNTKNQTVVKLTVVPCAPVVEVKIKRPDTKYQLGFSVQNGVICSLLRGGIAERGGVRVGHRIIEINNQSVVAVPHEKIVNLLATSVGEILMKTMPTSMFRLLTGQETPLYI